MADWVECSDVHGWFGLSYASYLVWPRCIMEQMPIEWQKRFVQLAEEIEEEFHSYPPIGKRYAVQFRDEKTGAFGVDPLREYRHPDQQLIETLRKRTRTEPAEGG